MRKFVVRFVREETGKEEEIWLTSEKHAVAAANFFVDQEIAKKAEVFCIVEHLHYVVQQKGEENESCG